MHPYVTSLNWGQDRSWDQAAGRGFGTVQPGRGEAVAIRPCVTGRAETGCWTPASMGLQKLSKFYTLGECGGIDLALLGCHMPCVAVASST
ncbi:hypothetical protein TREES_T100014859 [Tupaia chinensis]|uniref:Uncharacterized protein n=1 Tax=Tupaia chinensis TaxID=246437 RepID=L9KSX7_TUPCH|nr:hypothetical protein TREES_T100014859 [Tupaia chinensis]